jgi:hypothetical protein
MSKEKREREQNEKEQDRPKLSCSSSWTLYPFIHSCPELPLGIKEGKTDQKLVYHFHKRSCCPYREQSLGRI